jgi:hypothetical protein
MKFELTPIHANHLLFLLQSEIFNSSYHSVITSNPKERIRKSEKLSKAVTISESLKRQINQLIGGVK